MKDSEGLSLQGNIAFAVQAWFGSAPVVVPEALDALIGAMASIAVAAGCTTEERRIVLADHMRTNLLSALQHYANELTTR